MSNQNTTTIISFGNAAAESSGAIIGEIDGYMHLDADGNERSQFNPGEAVYCILHYDPAKVKIISMRPTDGGDVQYIGQVIRSRDEQQTFQHPGHAIDLRYNPGSNIAARWYGRTSDLVRSGKQLTAPGAPCLGKLTYQVQFEQYLHKPAPVTIQDGEEYPTDIIIEYREVT